MCYQHGDFWVGNLAQNGNVIILRDLEFSTDIVQPLYDLLHFGMYYHRIVRNIGKVGRSIMIPRTGGNQDQRVFELSPYDVETVLVAPGLFSKIMKECIKRYMKLCDININDVLQLIRNYIKVDRGIQDVHWVSYEKAANGQALDSHILQSG